MRARGRRACGEALWHVAIAALRTWLPGAKMSQNGCGCDGPVETKPFGEEIPDLKTLRITLPSLQPLSAAHDWDYWSFGARNEEESRK